MVYLDPKYTDRITDMEKALKDPTFYFDGEYVFDNPELSDRTGYALVSYPEPNDFGDSPTAVYYVYFKEEDDPRKPYIGYEYPPYGSIIEKSGTFYPFQETLF